MTHFTPIAALGGGLLIGLATAVYLVLTGRYAGISGILRGAAFGGPDRFIDALFVGGLILGGLAYTLLRPAPVSAGIPLWIVGIGGILVGIGTSLGRGCTSGHGVCGLGRFSIRSLAAVGTFIATGMVTVFILRHVFAIA